jgi:5-methyltetrahydrofolate--homocysteine methyltransferase
MVPAQKIIETAKAEKADVIGLSGLITPSLDEMVNFAAELERQGFDVPLLIGGATTSRAHTAVKVDQKYGGPVVWVKDASRSVPVVSQLLSDEQRPRLMAEVAKDYDALRARHAAKAGERPLLSIAEARARRTPIDWSAYRPPVPHLVAQQEKELLRRQSGAPSRTVTKFVRTWREYPLGELRDYIDWGPFFLAWEMKGRFPDILHNPTTGETATRLYEDALRLLDRVEEESWLTAQGVVGLFPANAVGDDIEVYTDETRERVAATLHTLRQQGQHRDGVPNRAMADFIAPRETGLSDHIGAFAVTAGHGIRERIEHFKADHDDYNAILLEALADRLAEAFAERMHERVRRELWGYGAHEHYSNQQLIREEYQGIRPAPGYPACPDHTEKAMLWKLLKPDQNAGITITESFAMLPTAAVSGWYLSHPGARYFAVGKIDLDQVQNYAARKQIPLHEAERWLAPNLGYEPVAATAATAA